MLGIFLQTARVIGRDTGRQVDVSAIGALGPILVFLVVGLVIFAMLRKIKLLGGFVFIDALVAVIIGILFSVNESLRTWLLVVIPWFAVLLMVIFFILALTLFICTKSVPKRFLVWLFLIVFIVIVILSGIEAFSGGDVISYLPGPYFGAGDTEPQLFFFFDWLYSPRISGAIWLILAAVIVTFVLMKFGD